MVKKIFYLFLLTLVIFNSALGYVNAAMTKVADTSEAENKVVIGKFFQEGKILKNTLVKVHEKGETNWIQIMTDGTGSFKENLKDGTYTVKGIKEEKSAWFHTNKEFTVKEGKVKASRNGEIVLPGNKKTPTEERGTNFVSGTIRNDGDLLKNTLVIYQEKGKANLLQTMTNAAGSFNSDLSDGAYTIKGFKGDNNDWFVVNENFLVKDGKIEGIKDGEISLSGKKQSEKSSVQSSNLNGFIKEGKKGIKADLIFLNDSEYEFDVYTVSSKGDGSFSASLPDGTYYLNGIEMDGGIYIYDLRFTVESGKVLVNGEPQENLSINLPIDTYTGKVEDSSSPLSDAYIVVEKQGTEYDEFIQEVVTNKKGEFSIRALKEGSYFLSVYHGTYSSWKHIEFEVKNGTIILDGRKAEALNMTVPDINVKGIVLDGKKPLSMEDAYVYFEAESHWYGMAVNTKGEFKYRLEDGNYRITQLYEHLRYTSLDISFEVRDGKMLQNSGEITELTIKLPPLSLNGTIIDGGKVVQGRVEILGSEKDGGHQWLSTTTDEKGIYSLRLEDGSYEVISANLLDEQEDVWLSSSFDIINGQLFVEGEAQSLQELHVPPITLKGIISEGKNTVTNANYTMCSDEQNYCSSRSLDSDGTFTVRMADGDYRFEGVQFEDGTQYTLNQPYSIRDGKTYVNGQQIDVLEVSVPPVTFKGMLTDAGVKVTGSLNIRDLNNDNLLWGYTDEEGIFKFRLPDGDYKVTDIYLHDGSELHPELLFSIISGELYINGQQQDLLEIPVPPLTLKGALLEAGNPISGSLYIAELNNSENPLYLYVHTNDQGEFETRLPDGNYIVSDVSLQDGTNPFLGIEFSIVSGQLQVNGQEQDRLVISVPPVTLNGILLDSGQPVEGYINFFKLNDDDTPLHPSFGVNEDGRFKLRLPNGDYKISEVYLYDGTSFSSNIEFSIYSGQLHLNGQPIDLLEISAPPVTLKGSLTDSGRPLGGDISIVETNNPDNPLYLGFGTNEEGIFQSRLRDGDYIVSEVRPYDGTVFNPRIEFSIVSGQLYVNGESHDSLEIPAPPVTLKGIITDSGNPISGSLSILDMKDPVNPESFWIWTHEEGKFQSRLPDGNYKLSEVSLYDGTIFNPDIEFSIQSGQLHVNGEPTDLLEIKAPPITLHGTLTDSGNPVSGHINIENIDPDTPLYFYISVYEDGNFQSRLPDGDYKVSNVYLYQDGTSFTSDITFSIKLGQLYVDDQVQDQLSISVPPITLKGKLIDAGNPITGYLSIIQNNNADNPLHFSKDTNEEGYFQFRLPDGDYKITDVYLHDGSTFYSGTEFSIVSGQLHVNGEPANELNVAIAPVSLSGMVYDGEYSVMDGYVAINSLAESGTTGYTGWIQNGYYQLRLPDGDYELTYVQDYQRGYYYFGKKFTISGGKLFVDEQQISSLDIDLKEGSQ